MTVEMISWSISTRVMDQGGIKLEDPGSAVRHVTDWAISPGRAFSYGDYPLSWWIYLHTTLLSNFCPVNLQQLSFNQTGKQCHSVDPDQMASWEPSWSGSTVISKKDKSVQQLSTWRFVWSGRWSDRIFNPLYIVTSWLG